MCDVNSAFTPWLVSIERKQESSDFASFERLVLDKRCTNRDGQNVALPLREIRFPEYDQYLGE